MDYPPQRYHTTGCRSGQTAHGGRRGLRTGNPMVAHFRARYLRFYARACPHCALLQVRSQRRGWGKKGVALSETKLYTDTQVLVNIVTTTTSAAVLPLTKAGARYLHLSSQFYHLHLNKTSYKNSSSLTHSASYTLQQDFSFWLIFLDLMLRPAGTPTTVDASKSWRTNLIAFYDGMTT